jgi:endonuclease YncB( thermonuclease family)
VDPVEGTVRRNPRLSTRRRGAPPWRRGARLGADQRAAVFWFLAFAVLSGGYGMLAPAVDDWRSGRRAMEGGCRVSRVIDGDTVDLGCPATGTVRARIVGYDTPELHEPGCAAERAAAERAKQVLATWVWHATSTEVAMLGHDRYGRTLVDMRLSGQRVATGMVESGLARRYFGRLRGGWCP